ncbi:MAG: hypothetical protein AAFV43_04290 [Planctomycetota bacterium]
MAEVNCPGAFVGSGIARPAGMILVYSAAALYEAPYAFVILVAGLLVTAITYCWRDSVVPLLALYVLYVVAMALVVVVPHEWLYGTID